MNAPSECARSCARRRCREHFSGDIATDAWREAVELMAGGRVVDQPQLKQYVLCTGQFWHVGVLWQNLHGLLNANTAASIPVVALNVINGRHILSARRSSSD